MEGGLFRFIKPAFVTTAVNSAGYPKQNFPEIAVVGRSNVGKSSLLNHLFGVKGLVRTSSVPGKTQTINFFTIDDKISFVDLPGWGYAKVPPELRKSWGPMVQEFFETRKTLRMVLYLLDIRRDPTDEDLLMVDWITKKQVPTLFVFTKVDKVTRHEQMVQSKKVLEAMGCVDAAHTFYSVPKNIGREELRRWITHEIGK